ncbi:hypothetical protein T484DRAFT_1849616 [Baffinella frigidus]|nr:hypothetical protein T484DRAFT_1849616 [Cryptophyta sp. CCMP2293]
MADQGHSHGGEACSGHGHDHGHSHGAPDKAEELTDYDGEGFVEVPGTDGGLLKKILTEGSGDETPIKGNMVSVHYVGTLTKTGNKFDSSRDRSGTFEFSVQL